MNLRHWSLVVAASASLIALRWSWSLAVGGWNGDLIIGIALTSPALGRSWYLLLSTNRTSHSVPAPNAPSASVASTPAIVLSLATSYLAWIAASLSWPRAHHPELFPAAAWIFAAPWLWLMELELRRWTGRRRSPLDKRPLDRLFWAPAVTACLVVPAVSLGVYFWQVRSAVGDVDFFYYLCYARDIVQDAEPISDNRYFYFPGVYTFWCAVMRIVGDSLPRLQTTVLLVLLANALLVALIVRDITRRWGWSLFAAIWYLVVCSRFQGFSGVTEPLATIPWLLGILIWNGRPMNGEQGWWRVVGLAACIGLTVYVKQQAGLLSLGAAWLVLRMATTANDRPRARHVVALPLIAVAILMIAVLAQGDGLRPLTFGAGAISGYQRQGNLLVNLYAQFRVDPLLALSAVACLGVALRHCLSPRECDRGLNTMGLLMFAAAASLVQFLSRPYHHYLLLAVPSIVISTSILLQIGLTRLRNGPLRMPAIPATVWIAGLLLTFPSHDPYAANVFSIVKPTGRPLRRIWHQQPSVAKDLEALAGELSAGERMYVLPPRHNSVYFLLGTRSDAPNGYTFQFPEIEQIPWQRYDTIVILRDQGLDPTDREKWPPTTADAATAALPRHGFQVRRSLSTMTLWRKKVKQEGDENRATIGRRSRR